MTPAEAHGPIGVGPGVRIYRASGAPGPEPGIVEEEWFLTGDAAGERFTTQCNVRRPADAATASGVVLVEATHPGNLWPVRSTTNRYLRAAGHVSVAVSSSAAVVERLVKRANSDRYRDLAVPRGGPAEDAILTAVAEAVRAGAPFLAGITAKATFLAGYSNTGAVTRRHHARMLDGRTVVFDGYFPGQTAVGTMPQPMPDGPVPVVELQGESEVIRTFERNPNGLTYRRDDSDKYRLYEVPSMPHMVGDRAWKCVEPVRTTFPLRPVWSAALHHLVSWVTAGVVPPSVDRIALVDGGPEVARDLHGHAQGGVPVLDLLAPVATLGAVNANHPDDPPSARCDMLGYRRDFEPEKLEALYGDAAGYVRKVEETLASLVRSGWLLPEDAEDASALARERTRSLFAR